MDAAAFSAQLKSQSDDRRKERSQWDPSVAVVMRLQDTVALVHEWRNCLRQSVTRPSSVIRLRNFNLPTCAPHKRRSCLKCQRVLVVNRQPKAVGIIVQSATKSKKSKTLLMAVGRRHQEVEPAVFFGPMSQEESVEHECKLKQELDQARHVLIQLLHAELSMLIRERKSL